MPTAPILRRIFLAGALMLPLFGVEAAQAMPAAPMPSVAGHDGIVAVQYMRYPNYRYRRFNRHRRVGLYRCGPGGLSTHLERKACRG